MKTCKACGKEEKEKNDFPLNDAPIYIGTTPEDIDKDHNWERREVCWSCIYKLKVLHHVTDELGESFTMYKDWKDMKIIYCTGQKEEGCYSEHFIDNTTEWPFECRCGTKTERPHSDKDGNPIWPIKITPKELKENKYECGHCGYIGPAYGTPTGEGVSASWCQNCEKNDKLTPYTEPEGKIKGYKDTEVCSLRREVMGLEACDECPISCTVSGTNYNHMCNTVSANPDVFPDVKLGPGEPKETNCPNCEGHGKYIHDDGTGIKTEECGDCNGTGKIQKNKEFITEQITPEEPDMSVIMHKSALDALEEIESWYQQFTHHHLKPEEHKKQMQNMDMLKDWMDASNPKKPRKNYYCGCGNVAVKYFIEREDGTFYWCGICMDFETMDMVLRCLDLYPQFEIGEYDGPLISCADGKPMTDEDKKLCKHWDTEHKQCTADDVSQVQNPLTECNGILMDCKNPKYLVEKWGYCVSCPACGNYRSKVRHNQCQYCNEPVTCWDPNTTTDST